MDAFYALAEPRRRRIMEILAGKGRLSATDIYSNFDISPQAISQHLKVLLDSKLLRMEKRAQQHIYEINPDSVMRIGEWSRETLRMWNGRLDRLDRVLEDEKKKSAKKR
ncbi:MAG: helix-turn-helix transcriptional regulator [Candidatus Micrarchaeota archaeon]|nr:helix-turn-helix transcriptional regulator [Candidatus Micrarchaeota archaeon]MDE1851625.1 helix-turn-helix transcriptional regulator [Candidatus Micrarchaeota archaeon]